jgi:predicted enzyme related to lactoylglutathione lyase
MFQKLRTVIYHVSDLAAAKDWYTEITGVKPYFDEPYYVGFDINGCELGLDPDTNHSGSGKGAVAYWKVENIAAAVAKCIATGASVDSEIQNVGGTIQVAIIKDPFGNYVGLISE